MIIKIKKNENEKQEIFLHSSGRVLWKKIDKGSVPCVECLCSSPRMTMSTTQLLLSPLYRSFLSSKSWHPRITYPQYALKIKKSANKFTSKAETRFEIFPPFHCA